MRQHEWHKPRLAGRRLPREWDRSAAPYAERIAALRRLHDAGCRTLVHIEPYPTPSVFEQDLSEILAEAKFVDRMFFGGWNYSRAWAGTRAARRSTSGSRARAGVLCAARNYCELA